MEINGQRVRLCFEEVGSQDADVDGQKPPIILLHGVTSAKETWKRVMQPIARATGRKVYAFDARNHGDSGWSDEFGYDVMRDDLLQFMDGLHVQKAVLIGHSMGGKTVMHFAAKWPNRVEKLIVEDISPKPASEELRTEAKKYVLKLMEITEKIPDHIKKLDHAKEFVYSLLQDNTQKEQQNVADGSSLPLVQDENGKYKWKTNLKTIMNTFLSGSNKPSHITGTYKGLALFLHGTKSPYKVTNDRDYILSIFPGARFRAVEGAAHQIHAEYEELFVSEVEHFVNESR